MAVQISEDSNKTAGKVNSAKNTYDTGGDTNAELKTMIGELISAVKDICVRLEKLEDI